MWLKLRLLITVAGSFVAVTHAQASVGVYWAVSGPEQELKTWDEAGFKELKAASAQEKDPISGKLFSYRGVLFSQVLEKAMASLPAERKAQVDLLVLKSDTGGQVLLPRSVVVKYPVLLALESGRASIVMPWTSKPKILTEDLPIESYFLRNVVRVELASYRERYGSVYLKRRTDPLAMRGEKLFVQNCVGCHDMGSAKPSLTQLSAEGAARKLATDGHPVTKGAPKISDRDRKAIGNYLNAFRAESGTGGALEGALKSALKSAKKIAAAK